MIFGRIETPFVENKQLYYVYNLNLNRLLLYFYMDPKKLNLQFRNVGDLEASKTQRVADKIDDSSNINLSVWSFSKFTSESGKTNYVASFERDSFLVKCSGIG